MPPLFGRLSRLNLAIAMICFSCGRSGHESVEQDVKRIRAEDDKEPVDEKNGDACGFTSQPLLQTRADGDLMVPPYHPHVRYIGRIDCTDKQALRMSHVGTQIQVWFEGKRLEMLLEDFSNRDYPNYYNIIIDGLPPVNLRTTPEKSRYLLADDLGEGVHAVTIFKRTESCAAGNKNNGKAIFKGFLVSKGGKLHPPPPMKRPVIEFIGDSITCGYGNEVATDAPEHYPYSTENSNGYLAYGAVAVRMLDGTYMPVAYSGRGVVRNWDSVNEKTLPEMYLDILPDDADPGGWDINRVVPDIVVVNLGSNDFSIGLLPKELASLNERFEREYGIFLETLRRFYPDALIILAMGPLVSDSHPPGYNAHSRIKKVLTNLVRQRRHRGDRDVHMMIHEHQTPPFGEDWHPTAKRHRIMAEELVSFIFSIKRQARLYLGF